MVSIPQRMRKLQHRLLAIRIGSGAIILPKDVKRIHMRFSQHIWGGHGGAKRFWRQELIRMKYHNPAVPMTIDRSAAQEDSCLMSVHFAPADAPQTSDSATSSPAAAHSSTSSDATPAGHTPTERVLTIDMKQRTNSEILDELIKATKAYRIEPTPAEREEMRELEEQKARSLKDSTLSQEVRARVKREKELLEQARGDVASQAA